MNEVATMHRWCDHCQAEVPESRRCGSSVCQARMVSPGELKILNARAEGRQHTSPMGERVTIDDEWAKGVQRMMVGM